MQTTEYVGLPVIGQRLGVPVDTLRAYHKRFRDHPSRPFPVPDVAIGAIIGYAPDRIDEVERWYDVGRFEVHSGNGQRPTPRPNAKYQPPAD